VAWPGRVAAAVLCAGSILWAPAVASAHATFVSSQPEPGQRLASAPGVVVLRFTEPLNASLSRASVTDPDGTVFEAKPAGQREVRVPLDTNAPGVYLVEWATVSTVDGHTLHGAFRFGVGVSPGAAAVTAVTPQPADIAIAFARAVEDAALLLAVGTLLVSWLARRAPRLSWAERSPRIPLTVAFGAGLAVVAGEALAAAPFPSLEGLGAYLGTGLPGLARLLRLAAEALAAGAAVVGSPLVPPLLGTAVLALAAAGHAAAVRPAWVGITVDAAHVVAAGLWAGGILALATVRPPSGWRGQEGRALLDRFTPVALPAFAATVALGTMRGAQELNGLADLVSSWYGRVLLLKSVAVLAMVPLSVRAWRRTSPAPRREAALGLVAVAAAALLAAYPLPPGRLVEAEEARERPARIAALPQEGDLTLGDSAGKVLVGVTVRPARPGPNEVLAYVLPLEGPAAAGDLVVTLGIDAGSPSRMTACGETCRRTEAVLRGGEQIELQVHGPSGGVARFRLPPLPAPDGRSLLDHAERRMDDLRSYRLEEVLRPAEPPLRARYEFETPNRMRMKLSTGAESILIGRARFTRDGPAAPWVRDSALPLDVPSFIWNVPGPVAPRILGSARVEGIRTRILTFFGPSGSTPIWFRLWIDRTGLVRQAEMRAQGHFMSHRYFGFDGEIEIRPPTLHGSGLAA
jgi:copper transport protein